MSCRCQNDKMARDKERARRLAKSFAEIQGETVALWQSADGKFGFSLSKIECPHKIIEYITPY